MSLHNETRIQELLTAWNRHQDLRRGGASIPELVASRSRLEAVRAGLH